MILASSEASQQHEEDPHLVLDVPRGSDRTAITKAYRRPLQKSLGEQNVDA